MNDAIKKQTRTAHISDSLGPQAGFQVKSMILFNKIYEGRGRFMNFGDQELIRFFKEKTMQQTRSRWWGHVR